MKKILLTAIAAATLLSVNNASAAVFCPGFEIGFDILVNKPSEEHAITNINRPSCQFHGQKLNID